MRLARVLVAMDDADSALASLADHVPAIASRRLGLKRGAMFIWRRAIAMNARLAYQTALESLGDDRNRPLLELKLADIPLVTDSLSTEEDA